MAADVVQIKVQMMDEAWQASATAYGYTIYGSGDVILEHIAQWRRRRTFRPLARVGVKLLSSKRVRPSREADAGRTRTTWTARKGPPWMSTAARWMVSTCATSGRRMLGNKTDVRWVALTDADGRGLLAVGMPHLEVSAHHYRAADLEVAAHTHELKRRPEIELHSTWRSRAWEARAVGRVCSRSMSLRPGGYRYALRCACWRRATCLASWQGASVSWSSNSAEGRGRWEHSTLGLRKESAMRSNDWLRHRNRGFHVTIRDVDRRDFDVPRFIGTASMELRPSFSFL